MLQITKSLYARQNVDQETLGNNVHGYSDHKIEKLYTQKEVNDLLNKKETKLSVGEIETDIESKNVDKQRRNDNRTVEKLVRKSNRILISISSHAFPLDLFPNTINVEEERITIIIRHCLSSEIHSIDIRNISNIFINRTFIFSQLVIISRTFEENEIRIRNLKTAEAIYVRRIIEGLRVLENNQIDTSHYSKADLMSKLEELSKTDIVT